MSYNKDSIEIIHIWTVHMSLLQPVTLMRQSSLYTHLGTFCEILFFKFNIGTSVYFSSF